MFQELIFVDKVEVKEDIYHLACQQSDLGVIKLLVKHAQRTKQNHNLEEGFSFARTLSSPGADPIRDYLFGDKNEFIKECLKNQSSLGEYMRQLHEKVRNQVYIVPEANETIHSESWSELGIVKAMFELQNRDKGFLTELCSMNINLDRNKNVEMLVLGNKSHFAKSTHLKSLMGTAAKNSKTEMLEFLKGEFPDTNLNHNQEDTKEIFQGALASNNETVLEFVLDNFAGIKQVDESFIKNCFESASETSGRFLIKEFTYLSDQDFLKKRFETAFINKDIASLERVYNTIENPQTFSLVFLKSLLESAVDSTFIEGIEFLVKNYSSIRNIDKTYTNHLLEKTSRIEVLECLMKQFPYLHELSDITKSVAENSMESGNVEKLTFFLDDRFSKVMIPFGHCNPDLLMKALENMSNPATNENEWLKEAIIDLFEYKATDKDFEKCKIIVEKVPQIVSNSGKKEERIWRNQWFISTLKIKLGHCPEQFQDNIWTHFIADEFQRVAKLSAENVSSLLETFPKLQTYEQLFDGLEMPVISKVLQAYPEKFKHENIRNYLIKVFQEAVKDNLLDDISFFLDNFEDLILHCNIPTVSSVLKSFPSKFEAPLMEKNLAQAFQESDLAFVTTYLTSFPLLSKEPLTEEMWLFAIQNSNLDVLYKLLKEVQVLKESEDELILFLLKTDLREHHLSPEELDSLMSLSCQRGSYELVSILIQKGAKVDRSAIEAAVDYGNVSIVNLLLQNAGNNEDYNGELIFKAADSSRDDVLKLLLKSTTNPDVDYSYNYAGTALHISAKNGNAEMVKLLLKHNATIDAKTFGYDETPLHIASEKGHLEVVKLLLDHKASINETDKYRETPLHKAAEKGHLKIVKVLLENSASILEKKFGDTAISTAAEKGHIEIVKLFLEKEGVFNEKPKFFKDALEQAASHGHLEVVQLLLPYSNSEWIQTALYSAAKGRFFFGGHPSIVKLLLDQGADKHLKNEFDETALMIAEEQRKEDYNRRWLTQQNYKEVIQLLT